MRKAVAILVAGFILCPISAMGQDSSGELSALRAQKLEDRQISSITGRGLESELPDNVCGKIILWDDTIKGEKAKRSDTPPGPMSRSSNVVSVSTVR